MSDILPVLVADPDALDRLLTEVRGAPALALDTESNSFHVYRERVCLVQLSTRERDYVLDPLAIDLRPVGAVLAGVPRVVLHGADYDVRCLKREYGFGLPGLFDTMAAARRLGWPGLGLAALVEHAFGVKLAKDSQRSDWGQRPLTPTQLTYAALDTHYLLALHDVLTAELRERGLLEAALEECARIAAVEPRPRVFDVEGWRRLKGARALGPEERGVLRALWLAREERASALDRPPFKVMPESAMVEVARRRPASEDDLRRIPGLSPHVLRRMGEALWRALGRAP